MPRLHRLFAIGLVVLASAGLAYSQAVNATMLGTVTDSTGAVVPNAKVTITETRTDVVHPTQTNESGNWIIPNLPPGIYAASVEATGFKKETRRDIALVVDTTTRVDIQLTPGNITETIEVTGAPPILQTDTASTAEQINNQMLANVPLVSANRNFQSLLNLAPGVAPVAEQHSQFFNASSSLQTEVNGQAREGNNTMIEGTDDNERTGLLQIYIPPIEAIQTVDVSLTNHDPEMGRAAAKLSGCSAPDAGQFPLPQSLSGRGQFTPGDCGGETPADELDPRIQSACLELASRLKLRGRAGVMVQDTFAGDAPIDRIAAADRQAYLWSIPRTNRQGKSRGGERAELPGTELDGRSGLAAQADRRFFIYLVAGFSGLLGLSLTSSSASSRRRRIISARC